MTDQLSLFDRDEETHPPPVALRGCAPNEAVQALARRLGPLAYLGTSSWHFPGWNGLVYEGATDPAQLARHGLPAYAEHPLLRSVSLDRTYYGPLDQSVFEGYARQVPAGFRFMLKAPADCTTPWLRGEGGKPAGENPRFLDPEFAWDSFVRPVRDGLGETCGPIVFQFPPQGRTALRDPRRFADKLHRFLSRLPHDALYAVEVRDAPLITDAYVEVLRSTEVRHCVSVHPRAAAMHDQLDVLEALDPGPLVARWNLNPAHTYVEAKERYTPFDQLQEEDPVCRKILATLFVQAMRYGQPAYLIVNNKAEGSAPLSVLKLAESIAMALVAGARG
ncbi:MAG: DUF72 domain-containing protein [Betaproteobacteria bacterium]